MAEKIKKIAVLTSGGDAPGMNSAVQAVVRTAWAKGLEAYLVYDGYKGLLAKNIVKATYKEISGISNRGGTAIGSARCPEFTEPKNRAIGAKNLRDLGIDALIVIGGDGSYQGAAKLSAETGIKTIGLPGTIDNDIASSDFTIGFDSALNEIVSSIDKLKFTSWSHERCQVVEVMGRHCGDLAIYAAQAVGVEVLSTFESKLTPDEIIKEVTKARNVLSKRNIIVLVSEYTLPMPVDAFAKEINTKTGIDTRSIILGNLQRGAVPTANDRRLAATLGTKAVEFLLQGKSGVCLGEIKGEVVATEIQKAVTMPRPDKTELIRRARLMA